VQGIGIGSNGSEGVSEVLRRNKAHGLGYWDRVINDGTSEETKLGGGECDVRAIRCSCAIYNGREGLPSESCGLKQRVYKEIVFP
jgi:hypothetical protein